MYANLHSDDTSTLLIDRRWSDYEEAATVIQADLTRLKHLAVRYQTQGYEFASDEPSERGTLHETPQEKAYRILRISPTVTNEQIKEVHKNLSRIYHPDAHNVDGDETHIKEINDAYDVLRKERRFK